MIRAVFLMLGVLAVLTLGGLGAPVMAEAPAAPCHEAAADGVQDEDRARPFMACCAACVAAPTPAPSAVAWIEHVQTPYPRPALAREGLAPAPEPGPPRA